jgi:HK97 family phage prohead protease
MHIEIRADNTAHISGYVNAVERESRPVITPHGRVVEKIRQGAFADALTRTDNLPLTVDHTEKVVADTGSGTLRLTEDTIGLKAEATVTDPDTVEAARQKRIRGWSFGMLRVEDEVEQRTGALPLRIIRKMDMDHITLVIRKVPVYSATSVEVRAGADIETESRSFDTDVTVTECRPDFSGYEARLQKLAIENRTH